MDYRMEGVEWLERLGRFVLDYRMKGLRRLEGLVLNFELYPQTSHIIHLISYISPPNPYSLITDP